MIGQAFSHLYKAYGEQNRHSADADFAIVAGRILAQDKHSLENLMTWYKKEKISTIEQYTTETLRQELLAIKGITIAIADSILLNAFKRPIFIVDSNTRRLFGRLAVVPEDLSYDEAQHLIEISLEGDCDLFLAYHELITKQCQTHCLEIPICGDCVLVAQCHY